MHKWRAFYSIQHSSDAQHICCESIAALNSCLFTALLVGRQSVVGKLKHVPVGHGHSGAPPSSRMYRDLRVIGDLDLLNTDPYLRSVSTLDYSDTTGARGNHVRRSFPYGLLQW